jgi:hypothetical protein
MFRYSPTFPSLLNPPLVVGVSDIQTNVEAKSVVVVHNDTVSKEVMLEKLQKWSAASGKSVALAS